MSLPPSSPAAAESESAREGDRTRVQGDGSLAGSPVTVLGDEGAIESEQLGWKEQRGEDVAYESLRRNLQLRTERGKGEKIIR